MRKVIVAAVLLTLLLFLLPLVIKGPTETAPEESEVTEPALTPGDWGELTSGVSLQVLLDGQVQTMDLNEYIWGVVAAEMPASFEVEALKAQAVAARTYALRRTGSVNPNHPDAQVCGSYSCCQAYISPERAAENWGQNAETYKEKIRRAVAETGREVILYDGWLIDAVFHSSSADKTVDAVEVWGSSLPYLQSVDSPEGDEVPNYHSQLQVDKQEFKDTFLAAHPEAVLEDAAAWFGECTYTAAGSVGQIVVGGVSVSGAEMRKLYGLRSAAFAVEAADSQISFQVVGFGHGVGMSQYGANAMAKSGNGYRDILTWYYSGVTVEDYTPPEPDSGGES